MCGIAGVLRLDGQPASTELLRRMIGAIGHRGPDAEGIWTEGPVGFAHARLSIIDIAGGQQPMSTSEPALTITYNGEIFNYLELRNELMRDGHRFRTQSDTEVILRMYAAKGEKCVEYLNGQWAFAIWDARRRSLFVSRDRLGVRPLFYARTATGFFFGSEMKSILAEPAIERTPDLETLDQVFTFWSAQAPRTMLKGILELPPGHSMVVAHDSVRIERHWQLDYSAIDPAMDENRCAEEVLALLDDATRLRLRSDVPVGAYLSGGLDSSLIAALARRHSGSRLETFSVTFEDGEFDESAFQSDVVNMLGTEHSSVRCSYDDICSLFPQVIRHAETPLLRTAPTPLLALSGLVRRRGRKVVLTGEGADEFFGGYDLFKEAKIRRFWAAEPASSRRPQLLKRLYPYLRNLQEQPSAYLQAFFRVAPGDLSNALFSHLPRWELTAKLKSFLSHDVRASLASLDARQELERTLPAAFGRWDPFSRAQFLEATGLLPGYLLSSQGDRMAMAHGVEGRFPFLDHRLVELSTRIPPRLKMRVLNEKYILKRIAGGLAPASVIRRTKQPYRAPDAMSFFDVPRRRARASYVEDALSPAAIRDAGLFDPTAVGLLIDKARNGRTIGARDNMALVGILSTQLWHDQFIRPQGARFDAGR